MKTLLALFIFMMIATTALMAQSGQISGTVKDSKSGDLLGGVTVMIKNTVTGVQTDSKGHWKLKVNAASVVVQFTFIGYQKKELTLKVGSVTDILLEPDTRTLQDVVVVGFASTKRMTTTGSIASISGSNYESTEAYGVINENTFHNAQREPLSTFSADVDRASYSNIRRFLNNGEIPPSDAIRVEEMINYFDYHYPQPKGDAPVAIVADMAVCPWNTKHQLVRIGIQGKTVETKNLPPSNLVFLLDVSGSMEADNKLPLVKRAMEILVKQLRPEDKVSIVVYAGAAGEVLPATSGAQKEKILAALEKLQAGGSTAGGDGIQLAYTIAAKNFLPKGNNRVILATDGDFNVGPSSSGELQRIIEKERERGISLSVLGFGMGNIKDVNMETLADKGNGNYAYIDNYEEARRTFETEFGGTLFTIAKDVKLQVEFNPATVQSYRLVGYENRLLDAEDFNNDKKDAGDMGAGHTVTALYEVIPVGSDDKSVNWIDPLKYQQSVNSSSNELLTVKVRYKNPTAEKSKLLQVSLGARAFSIDKMDADFRMAAAVASFGQLLRGSSFKGNATYDDVLNWASRAKGDDPEGYRSEFLQLVKKARLLNK
ncbi:von Willebrand factor type A domain-containing protein [Chitinophaga sp. Hz27]|uniref:vWA domain-containing protein n=1 Tax=Chitinophaga sp. Hz27 TaxID=3347169 RepID=UPI0035E00B04